MTVDDTTRRYQAPAIERREALEARLGTVDDGGSPIVLDDSA